MAKKGKTLFTIGIKPSRQRAPEHMRHQQDYRGTGDHGDKTKYTRKQKHKRDYRETLDS